MSEPTTPTPSQPGLDHVPPPASATPRWMCPFFAALGLVSTALGILGMFLPGLPTTIFLIIALWAFSRSSQRLKMWLWTHPKFGPGLQAWHIHRVIPLRAKISAVAVMCLSTVILVAVRETWTLPMIVVGIMVPIAIWICTRRSEVATAVTVGVVPRVHGNTHSSEF